MPAADHFVGFAEKSRYHNIGPWFYAGTTIYHFGEVVVNPAGNHYIACWRSTDGGATWAEQDQAHRPNILFGFDTHIQISIAFANGVYNAAYLDPTATNCNISTFDPTTNLWSLAPIFSTALPAQSAFAGPDQPILHAVGADLICILANVNISGLAGSDRSFYNLNGGVWFDLSAGTTRRYLFSGVHGGAVHVLTTDPFSLANQVLYHQTITGAALSPEVKVFDYAVAGGAPYPIFAAVAGQITIYSLIDLFFTGGQVWFFTVMGGSPGGELFFMTGPDTAPGVGSFTVSSHFTLPASTVFVPGSLFTYFRNVAGPLDKALQSPDGVTWTLSGSLGGVNRNFPVQSPWGHTPDGYGLVHWLGTNTPGNNQGFFYFGDIIVLPPVLTVGPAPVGGVGVTYSDPNISATGAPVFTATGLPPGLAINPATGAITGTPTLSGVYTVTVTATNGGGAVSAPVTITILARILLSGHLALANALHLQWLDPTGAKHPPYPLRGKT